MLDATGILLGYDISVINSVTRAQRSANLYLAPITFLNKRMHLLKFIKLKECVFSLCCLKPKNCVNNIDGFYESSMIQYFLHS